MNKLLIVFSLAMSLLFSGRYNSGEPREGVLKIYNWADYIGDGVPEDSQTYYKEQTGRDVRIVYQTFDTNEIMLTKIEKGHEDFDVIRPSEYIIEQVLKRSLLLPIDTVFPHPSDYMNDVLSYIRGQIDKLSQPRRIASHYAARYMWGTTGTSYNKVFAPEADTESWNCFWDRRYTGEILMKNSYRDAYGTATIYAHTREPVDGKVTVGNLMNGYSPHTMEIAEKYFRAMKPNIAGQEADLGKEMMTRNKAWFNMTWSGDTKWVIEETDAVGVEPNYTVPREGSSVWYGEWITLRYAGNPKAASYFISFMCRPDIALRNMEASGYVSVVALPKIMEAKIDTTLTYYSDLSYFFGPGTGSLWIDKIQYPDREVAGRCATIRDFGDKTKEAFETWSRIKDDNLGVDIAILIFMVVGLMSGWMIYKRVQCYKHEEVQRRRSRRRRRRRWN